MYEYFRYQVTLHELSFYMLTRGLCLTAVFLLAAVVLLLCSGTWAAAWCADYMATMGGVLLGAALIGPLLVEDILRKSG